MFVGVHAALAVRTNTPELMLEPAEGEAFMKAAQKVLRHYNVQAQQKTLDWIAFAGCCGSIYGTRLWAIQMRRQMERQEGKGTGKVINFPHAPRSRPEAVAPVTEPPPAVHVPPAPNTPPDTYVPSVVQEFDGAGLDEFGGFQP